MEREKEGWGGRGSKLVMGDIEPGTGWGRQESKQRMPKNEADALMKHEWLVVADLGSRQGQREERIYLAADLDPALFEGPLAELAPRTLEVPSGSRIRLDYSDEMPVLAVRLQELFGLADTPRIANGRQASSCTCCAGHPGPGELLAQYLRGSEERFTR